MREVILTINIGSSSLKFAIYTQLGLIKIAAGQVSKLNQNPDILIKDAENNILLKHQLDTKDNFDIQLNSSLEIICTVLDQYFTEYKLSAIGHRVIHAGAEYPRPSLITEKLLKNLEKFIPIAPLHQPYHIQGIQFFKQHYPNIVQIACPDTSFHQTQPKIAQIYALPEQLPVPLEIKRHGFHGISYDYIVQQLPLYLGERADGKIIIAHLGQGASLCAVDHSQSIATTMGFSALDGLPMGTRCGALDPGVILYLSEYIKISELTQLLYKKSGLFALSGSSSNINELIKDPAPRAKQAIEYFIYRINQELGALVATLGGLDALVFTGGIGTHIPQIRELVCQKAKSWLKLDLDFIANQKNEKVQLHTEKSAIAILSLPTDEEFMIAKYTNQLINT